MPAVKEVLKWTVYTLLAIIAVGVVAASGVFFLVLGAIVSVLVVAGLIVWFVAALIKEHWESRALRK